MDVPADKPLLGTVLCCTSIPPEQRTELAEIAQAMGAMHKLDLTADVTHLIVGNIDTPKYKYVAKQRQDIKVLGVSWLEAVRTSWMECGETDIAALEEEHKLPTFAGLHICVTGFDDLNQRTEMQDTITHNGAQYHGDLTKTVTHLIAAAPRGKKYEYAGQWGMKIVSIEWFEQSLERGMALEESLFHPTIAAEDRGVGAVIRRRSPSPILGKRQQPADPPPDPGRRKLRRTASAKLGSQTDGIWADIGSGESHESLALREQSDRALRRVQSLGDVPRQEPGGHEPTPTIAIERVSSHEPLSHDARSGRSSRTKEVFKTNRDRGERLFVFGFGQRETQILEKAVISNGAQLLSEEGMRQRLSKVDVSNVADPKDALSLEDAVTIIVPYTTPPLEVDTLRSADYVAYQDEIVTDMWVEKCMYLKEVADKKAPLCEPFEHFPIEGFEDLTICPTSFTGPDLLHFSRAVKLLGGTYEEKLHEKTSVLVSNGIPNREKLAWAVSHQIPIVSSHWMWQCVRSGTMQPLEDFGLKRHSSRDGMFYHPTFDQRPATKDNDRTNRPQADARKNKVSKSKTVTAQQPAKEHARPEPLARRKSPTKPASSRTSNSKENTSFVTAPNGSQQPPLQEIAPEVNSPQPRVQSASSGSNSGSGLDLEKHPSHDEVTRGGEQEHEETDSVLGDITRHNAPTILDADADTNIDLPPTQNTTLNKAIAHLLAQKKRQTTPNRRCTRATTARPTHQTPPRPRLVHTKPHELPRRRAVFCLDGGAGCRG